MKVLGITKNIVETENAYTLVKVALKYVKAFKYETEIISTEEFDFSTESTDLKTLQEKLENADAVIFSASSFKENEFDIEDFLAWLKSLKMDNTSKVAGSILLIDHQGQSGVENKNLLHDEMESLGYNVISDVYFTKVADDKDVRSNTQVLSDALKIGEAIQTYLSKHSK